MSTPRYHYDLPTVGFTCVGLGGWAANGCQNIHRTARSAAECRYSDAHEDRTVRAVYWLSRGARPRYRAPTVQEAAQIEAARAAIEAEERPPRGVFPALVLVAMIYAGCGNWLPEGGAVDCIAAADAAQPVTDSVDERASWSAAFATCKMGGP